MTNLDDVQYFLALTRHPSLVRAAEALQVSRMTVKRRISSIESQLGGRLFDRTVDGWVMTSLGRSIVERAERIEAVASELFSTDSVADGISGTVRIVTTDGFGHNVLPDWMAQVIARYPAINVEVITASRFQPFNGRDFDIAITVHRPELTMMHTRVLTEYSLGLYAADSYLERKGVPTDAAELADHDFVWFIESLHDLPELQFLRPLVPDAHIVAQFSTVNGQESAAVAGIGIGLLPRFSADRRPGLRRVLDSEIEVVRTFYMAVRDASVRLPQVQAVIDFLIACASDDHSRFSGRRPRPADQSAPRHR